MDKIDPLTLSVGETSEQFIMNNQDGYRISVDRQPAGLNFYQYRWPSGYPGAVFVSHDEHSFVIPHALSITAREDGDRPELGLAKFTVNSRLSFDPTIPHDQARTQLMAFLQNVTAQGWKPVITYENPRLIGEESFRYYEEVTYYNLPVDYIPTLEQWMRIKRAYWQLHAGNVVLKIQMMRDRKLMDVAAPGAYFIAFTIYSKEELGKAYVDPSDRHRWEELWVENIKKLKIMRYEKERELEERGFTIFTEYEEPLIHPEDPVEP